MQKGNAEIMPETQGYIYGKFESLKFDHRRKRYNEYVNYLKEKHIPTEDYLNEFTAYVGHMSLNRALTIYELYKKH